MRKISPASALAYIASMAALLIVLIPGLASASVDDIWRVVSVAKNHNQQTLNSFASSAVQAADVGTLASLRSSADQSLEDIYFSAEAQINAYVDADPELESDGASALAQLLADHNYAHAEVADIYETVYDALTSPTTTTTTTVAPTTTTTAPSSTTTTTQPRATTTTTEPPTTTTTEPEPEETTTTTEPEREAPTTTTIPEERDTTSTTLAGVVGDEPSDPSGGAGDAASASMDTDEMMSHVIAMGEGQLWGAPPAATTAEVSSSAMPPMTAAVSDAASVLLPPAVVTIAVAPLLVLEVLVGTIFESARSLALPALLLMAAVGWFVWKERQATKALSV